MTPELWAIVGLVVGNVIGAFIAYGRSKQAYGNLQQKVSNLDDTINNGLCEKVDGISRHLATLEGKVDVFIQLGGETRHG